MNDVRENMTTLKLDIQQTWKTFKYVILTAAKKSCAISKVSAKYEYKEQCKNVKEAVKVAT